MIRASVATVITDPDVESGISNEKPPAGPRIRCPLCGWMPDKHDEWECTCGHV
jgi:hypothetical protein